jgi:hypothetical protein
MIAGSKLNGTAPVPNGQEIARAISTLHPDGGIIELRAIYKGGRKRIDAGCFDFDHRELAANEAIRLNRAGAAVYFNLNQLDKQLQARYSNRVEEYASSTATDNNVTRRCWVLIDLDAQRPKDTSSTPEQLAQAIKRGCAVMEYLSVQGWPKPVSAESGNGYHLLYPINLPNDDASRTLISGCLKALAGRFDDAVVNVDQSVFNAARIIKLHGTIANKGDNIPAAPWRLSKLTEIPERVTPVAIEHLEALAAESGNLQRDLLDRWRLAGFPYQGWHRGSRTRAPRRRPTVETHSLPVQRGSRLRRVGCVSATERSPRLQVPTQRLQGQALD